MLKRSSCFLLSCLLGFWDASLATPASAQPVPGVANSPQTAPYPGPGHVWVHLDADVTRVVLAKDIPNGAALCEAPCDTWIGTQTPLRILGNYVAPSQPFSLPSSSEPLRVDLRIVAGTPRKRSHATIATVLGAAVIAGGVAAILGAALEPTTCNTSFFSGTTCEGPADRHFAYALGALLIVGGAVTVGIGSYFIKRSKVTTVRIVPQPILGLTRTPLVQ